MKIVKTASGKYRLTKKAWMEIGEMHGWLEKKAMAVWLPDDIKEGLREENWLVDLMADKVPPEVGITKLRSIDPDIAVIVTTGHDFTKEKELYGELGAEDYILKPFNIADLVYSVRNVLDRRNTRYK